MLDLMPQPPPIEPTPGVRGRIQQLDGLRAVAILAVFLQHIFGVPLFWVGVDIFFVLSGFLITGILLGRKAAGGGYFTYFYRRRAFRILPPYVLAILMHGLLISWKYFHPVWLFIFFGMNIQTLYWDHPLALPFWSLAVEEQFYLVWPVVILLVSEKMLLRLAIAAVVVTPLLRVLCTPMFPNHYFIYLLTPFRADLLCAGAILSILWKHRSARFEQLCRTRGWVGVVAGFGGLAMAQFTPHLRLVSNTRAGNGLDYSLALIGSTALLAWTLADRGWLYKLLTLAPVRYLGQVSYTVYLVHLIAIELVIRHTSSRLVVAAVSLVGIMVYASISWFVMERPLIAYAARTTPHKVAPKIMAAVSH